ncbi:Putative LOC100122304, partial [Caligus rogercresseyi]
KHEGIISSSLKRKMRDAMIQEQELRHQQEERKKYLGPVGKNPWAPSPSHGPRAAHPGALSAAAAFPFPVK